MRKLPTCYLFKLQGIINMRIEYLYIDDPNKVARNTDCWKNASFCSKKILKEKESESMSIFPFVLYETDPFN